MKHDDVMHETCILRDRAVVYALILGLGVLKLLLSFFLLILLFALSSYIMNLRISHAASERGKSGMGCERIDYPNLTCLDTM